MLDEYELVLLACSIEKTEEQKNRIDILLEQKLDWERITGFIFQNRLAGFFLWVDRFTKELSCSRIL